MKVTDEMIAAAQQARARYPLPINDEFWTDAAIRERVRAMLDAAIAAAPGNRIEIDLGDSLRVPTVMALAAVLTERVRQIAECDFDEKHDDEQDEGALALAAACYADHAGRALFIGNAPDGHECPGAWPFRDEWWKPKDPRRNLVRAAALILAEIERIDRHALRAQESQPTPVLHGDWNL